MLNLYRTIVPLLAFCVACGGDVNSNGIEASPVMVDERAPTGGVVGQGHYCVVRAGGVVACWGANGSGELGAGFTSTNSLEPVVVSGLSNVAQLAIGALFTCALRENGTVACWGRGFGDTPSTIAGVANAVQIAASTNDVCAVLQSGDVTCWTGAAEPTLIADLDPVTHLAGGNLHFCALRGNGTVACWGSNDAGQLGLGVPAGGAFSDPTDAIVFEDVAELALGLRHTCARLESGSVVCAGTLPGLGFSMTQPEVIPSLTDAVRIAAGSGHVCALRSTGAVTCLGPSPAAGESGVGQLSLPAEALDVGAGVNGSCALLADSSIYCWGSNSHGELGDGGSGPASATPVRIQF